MNVFPSDLSRYSIPRWLIYQSGIPTLTFLAGLLPGDPELGLTLPAILIGIPGLLWLHRLVGNRTCEHPVRLFLGSVASLALASLALSLATCARDPWGAGQDRLERWREVQHILERVWSVEASMALLPIWLILILTARLLRSRVEPPAPEGENLLTGPVRVLVVAALVALSMVLVLLADPRLAAPDGSQPRLRWSPMKQGPLWQIARRHCPEADKVLEWDVDGKVELSDEELWSLYDAIADEVEKPGFTLDSDDNKLLGILQDSAQRFQVREPSYPRVVNPSEQSATAHLAMATLGKARRMGLESLHTRDISNFRAFLLPWIAQADLSQTEIDRWRARSEELLLSPATCIESLRDDRYANFESEPPLTLLGRPCRRSLPEMAFDLEGRWRHFLQDYPARAERLRRLQPEAESLRLILDIKEHKLREGSYPACVSSELASYIRGRQGGRMNFHDLEYPRHPVSVTFP